MIGRFTCQLRQHCDADPNSLENGIRIVLADGGMLVVPDDQEEDERSFSTTLGQSVGGRVAELASA